jgi:4-diphosphocytidyl-2-C-methyl-D-erythritol kinase
MNLERDSHCKVNLVLNILGKRPDGYHNLESIMHPVMVCDRISFSRKAAGTELSCSDPTLPVDSGNLVFRAATMFLEAAGIKEGVRIHLEKKLPLAAGLGGGSGNAACTLRALNELFGLPLAPDRLHDLAARLGSDIPFFLQPEPALVTGRGEHIQPLGQFPALKGAAFLLVHPGFGISTSWAYKELARFPQALNGQPGLAGEAVAMLRRDFSSVLSSLYNALEAPALAKYPLLELIKEFFGDHGGPSLMSGSGSTVFAITQSLARAESLAEAFRGKFGNTYWIATVDCASGAVASA